MSASFKHTNVGNSHCDSVLITVVLLLGTKRSKHRSICCPFKENFMVMTSRDFKSLFKGMSNESFILGSVQTWIA